jgi:hypothetical protein
VSTALQLVWTLSIALAALSLVSMTVLIGARLVRQHRDRGLLERRKQLSSELLRYALSGGDWPVFPARTRRDRALAIQTALDTSSLLNEEARARVSDALRRVSIDARLRDATRRGRVPDRVAALEALRLFPGPATSRSLEVAQTSPIFRICLAALRTRVELGDLPDLATVLRLCERPEGGRSLSLFKIIEACVRSDLPGALLLLTPELPSKARIMLLKALGASGSWAAFRDIASASLDQDPEIRAASLTALRALGIPAATTIFVAATRDPDWQVRLKAVEGIGQLGKPQDRPSIEPLLNDAVWWIRFRADEALRRLDGRGGDLRLPQDPPKTRKRSRPSKKVELARAS